MFEFKSARVAMVLAASAALAAGPALAAKKDATPPLQVSYPADAGMSCEQVSGEISRMEQIMGISNSQVASANAQGRAAEIGASVAINGALYSGALGAVPGLGLFAHGASFGAKRAAAAKAERAQQEIRTAEQRRAMLMGMYQGKSCAAAPAVVEASAPAAPAAVAPAVQAVPATEAAATPST